MIYTVTFNPSIDYIVEVDDFKLGMTNRTSYERMLPGGKGINVSILLNNLGIESTTLGFKAGFVGEQIESMVKEFGVKSDFIGVSEGCSRINIKVSNIDGTEINGMGPIINTDGIACLMAKLDALDNGDVLVLAGSIPKGMPDDIYESIMERLSDKKITIVVDATKNLLLNVLKHHPFLIKPNQHELGEIFGVELDTKEAVIPYARKLKEMGAINVLISMGGQGAVLIDEDGKVYMADAPKGEVENSVGAGDSMVAGFLAGFLEKQNYHDAFKMGVASGSASAFSKNFATKAEVDALYGRVVAYENV